MKTTISSTLFALALLSASAAHADNISHGGTSVSIDFVGVGNTGNAADVHGDGYGAVGYNYRIGKYEISETQWDAVVLASSSLLFDSGHWSDDQPVAHINWHDAAMFCNWLTSGNVKQGAYEIEEEGLLGKVTGIDRASAISTYGTAYVLPTENEWYKAAYYDPGKSGGAGYWDYPTKHDFPGLPDGLDSNTDTVFDAVFSDHSTVDPLKPNDVTNAGLLSAYGTMGQGGNVSEWTETTIGTKRRVRGGAWYNFASQLNASTNDITLNSLPTNQFSDYGFRVASVPEPGSITLLVSGIGTLLLRRRRKK